MEKKLAQFASDFAGSQIGVGSRPRSLVTAALAPVYHKYNPNSANLWNNLCIQNVLWHVSDHKDGTWP